MTTSSRIGHGRRALVACCCLLSLPTYASFAAAAEPEAKAAAAPRSDGENRDRVLRQHVFVDAMLTPSPFITSHLVLQQAVAYASVPDFPITPTRNVDADALEIMERIELGLSFIDMIEVIGFVGGNVLTGTNVRSVVLTGSSFSYEAGLGGALRLLRSESAGSQLSLRAQGSSGSGNLLDLFDLLRSVIEQDPATLEAVIDNRLSELVVRDISRRQASAHLVLGQALSRNFGVQAALGGSYEWVSAEFFEVDENRTITEEKTTWSPELGAAFEANAAPSLPFGVVIEYSLRRERHQLAGSDGEDWGGLSHFAALGVHAVHPQFHAGLAYGTVLGLEEVEREDPTTGQILTSDRPIIHFGRLIIGINW